MAPPWVRENPSSSNCPSPYLFVLVPGPPQQPPQLGKLEAQEADVVVVGVVVAVLREQLAVVADVARAVSLDDVKVGDSLAALLWRGNVLGRLVDVIVVARLFSENG